MDSSFISVSPNGLTGSGCHTSSQLDLSSFLGGIFSELKHRHQVFPGLSASLISREQLEYALRGLMLGLHCLYCWEQYNTATLFCRANSQAAE